MLKKKFVPLLAVCLIVLQSFAGIFVASPTASAITADEISSNMQKYSYYSAFHGCLLADTASQFYSGQNGGDYPNIARTDYWLTIGYIVGSDGDNNDGAVTCNNAAKFVTSQLGIGEEDLLKGLGYVLSSTGSAWEKPCTGGRHSANNACLGYASGSQLAASFKQLADQKGIPTSEPEYGFYTLAYAGYTKACGATKIDETTASTQVKAMANAGTGGYNYIKEIPDTSGTSVSAIYKIDVSKVNNSYNIYPRPGDTGENQGRDTCKNMASALNGEAASRFTSFLGAETAKQQKAKIMDVIDTYCLKIFPNGQPGVAYQECLNSTYKAQQTCWGQVVVKSTIKGIPDEYRDRTAKEKATCLMEQGVSGSATEIAKLVTDIEAAIKAADTPADPLVPGGSGDGTTEAACTGGALGWFLCPLVNLASETIQKVAPWMEEQLVIAPMIADSPQAKSVQTVWQIVVGIANLALVIAFLVVIFSQATSLGLSAYGIKKMLPRIIAAAILINLSFFICSIAIDMFNIIGGSIKGIINSGITVVMSSTSNAAPTSAADMTSSLVTWAGGIIVAGALGLLGFVVPALVAGVLAVISMLVIVALRQVVILLLIIVAPLAFAAMILPGTEPLFKKWYKALLGLLVMYPVIMAILYGCSLISAIILAGAGAI